MKKYLYFFLIVFLLISISMNISLKSRLESVNTKITQINNNTSLKVERSIRQSIANTKELIDLNSKEALFNLQRTIDDLATAFNQWLDLNQTEATPNTTMRIGLNGIESIRNTLIHHLTRQYIAHGELQEEDIEMLERTLENLNRLLLVYHNIEGRVGELRQPNSNDGGLVQAAQIFEDINRLYRHSSRPNRHPEYMEYEKSLVKFLEAVPELKNLIPLREGSNILVREGVHYYNVSFYDDKNELKYVAFIDAIDGSVRNLEYRAKSDYNLNLSMEDTLMAARNFLRRFYAGEVLEESLYIKNDSDDLSLYSFRFTPAEENIKVISDAYIINICTKTGKVLRYTNDFSETKYNNIYQGISKEEAIAKYTKDTNNMQYSGLAVVRSFRTRFKPTLTYSYITIQKNQQLVLYFCVNTGSSVHQFYNVYEPILEL